MEINRCLQCMAELASNAEICRKCGTRVGSVASNPIAVAPATILHGKYLIGAVLGQGGFGITYIGFDLLLEIPVAIKEYFPAGKASRSGNTIQWHSTQLDRQKGFESFLKEARKMAKLDNIPSVVRVREVFLDNETAYIVMDFVEGETLGSRIKREGVMSPEACVGLLMPIMKDLCRVHEAGILHRDIKPDNIMLRPDGSAVLLDLGAAKELSASQMEEGKSLSSSLVVSHGFSPFEQYMTNGKVGPWTDVYALCATIYYCTTGKIVPSAMDRMGDSVGIELPEGMPERFTSALTKGLALQPNERTKNVPELIEALGGEKINYTPYEPKDPGKKTDD